MTTRTKTDGISFTNGLALLFIGLKLADVIAWPWLWVLSPLWIPVAVIAVAAVVGAIVISTKGR